MSTTRRRCACVRAFLAPGGADNAHSSLRLRNAKCCRPRQDRRLPLCARPSTDLRCVSYCLVTDGVRGLIKTWQPGQSVPAVFVDVAQDPEALTCVFNDAFDRQIHEQILTPRYGWPAIPLSRRRCAQAAALARALPGSLDGAAAALKIGTRKTAAGIAAMKRLAKPKKPAKKQKGTGAPDFSATLEELAILIDYNRADVLMAMEVVDRVRLLPASEQAGLGTRSTC